MTNQLIAPPPEPQTVFDAISIFLIDVFLWTALLGAFAFWILIPAGKELAAAIEERGESN
ncbi:MAG: hypothetical protein J07HN4v3_02279 [Halonotius sp. J07HN4]|nr:MAG: hypothetical protein J07HN4v3_02279 [Halonotius sp. J07HN4]